MKEVYPEIIATDLIEGYIGNEERYIYQYPIVMQYLKKKIDNRCVTDYLKSVGIERIVIYAATEFAELLVKDILNTDTDMIWAVCDKKAKAIGKTYNNCKVISIDEMMIDYSNKKFDKIVVCSIFHKNAVIDELLEKGVDFDDILTAIQVIFWM